MEDGLETDYPCTCGHAHDEHGDDPMFPGSTMCVFNRDHSATDGAAPLSEDAACDCVAYEPNYDFDAE